MSGGGAEVRVQVVVSCVGVLRGEADVILVNVARGRTGVFAAPEECIWGGQRQKLHVVGGGVALALIVAAGGKNK